MADVYEVPLFSLPLSQQDAVANEAAESLGATEQGSSEEKPRNCESGVDIIYLG